MRIQGVEQEVCQLFFATFRQMFDFTSGKRTIIAAPMYFVSTNESIFVTTNDTQPGKPAKKTISERSPHGKEQPKYRDTNN